MLNPRELDPPTQLQSERLILKATREDDSARINAAVLQSWPELSRWMAWARVQPTVQDSTFAARHMELKWQSRQEFDFCFNDPSGALVGKGGLHTLDWNARQGEIGYWLVTNCTGHGFATEATLRLCEFAWELGLQRLEILCDARNIRSCKVAERAAFTLESTRIGDRRDNADRLADTLIWTRFR
jgi:RimJ/RimL family protein N-acetyltransferase